MKIDTQIKKLERKIASLKAKASKAAAKSIKLFRTDADKFAKKHGYHSIEDLVSHLDDLENDRSTMDEAKNPPKRKRGKITDKVRQSVVSILKSGKTVAEVAKMHKISTATVNNIKKAAGLTKSKKPKKSVPKKRKVKKAAPSVAAPSTPPAS